MAEANEKEQAEVVETVKEELAPLVKGVSQKAYDKLKAELDAVRSAGQKALATVDDARTALSNELEKVKGELVAAKARIGELHQEIEEIETKAKQDILALENELKAKATGVADTLKKDCVVLEGKVYDILHFDRVWEFVHGRRLKAGLDENHTAVVIPRLG